jgi:hypothetical protein
MKRYKCRYIQLVEDPHGRYVVYTPLVEAAPLMLETLQEIESELVYDSFLEKFAERVALRIKIQKVIAKVKGEQP